MKRAVLPPLLTFQFTHPGRGATDYWIWYTPATNVSIHAPREGCDYRFNPFRLLAYQFQFTHPGRGATVSAFSAIKSDGVSIHAPREGCDKSDEDDGDVYDVSIHAPREGCDVSLLK